ncbi:hypothetical protein [Mesorhizobium sp.]|uniref:hypothetical protein n=1 Tax=Mesorhizobium sp. TaxID=1871066 RepID=UPI0011F9DB4B|nr:hypothetical protein [Mesorhizobium sp.]TIL64478.1 MAG: hypothetical protein E5Y77_26190 [Mesorhizobium sp.]
MPKKTLADTLAARETIYVNCAHPMCCKSTKLDIQALIDRLGRDHGSIMTTWSGSLSAQTARLPVVIDGRCSSLRRPAAGAQSRLEANFGTRGLKVAGATWGGVGGDCLVGRRPSGLASAALILPSLGRSE